jgi:hypothetical protein
MFVASCELLLLLIAARRAAVPPLLRQLRKSVQWVFILNQTHPLALTSKNVLIHCVYQNGDGGVRRVTDGWTDVPFLSVAFLSVAFLRIHD